MFCPELADFLRARIDKPLSREDAESILLLSLPEPLVSHGALSDHKVAISDGYTLQVERMCDVIEEIRPLHFDHWKETEAYRQGQDFEPDYAAFCTSEAGGRFLLFTARHAGKLVGNCALYLHRSTHTGQLIATEDTLFVLPAYRRGTGLGRELVKFAHAGLRQVGVREVRVTTKTINLVSKLLERMGYSATATVLTKQL